MSAELRPPPPGHDLLTAAETARALGCKRRIVLTWLGRGGKFTGAIRTPGGHWRIPAAEVRRLRAQLGITDPSTDRSEAR